MGMEQVNTLKMEDEEVQKRSKETIDRVNAQLTVDFSALVNASNRVMAVTKDAAEAKIKVLFKAMGIEKKEEMAEEAKAGAASGEASAREKSASKEQEAIAEEQEMMTELTAVI